MDLDEILQDRKHGSTYIVREYLSLVERGDFSRNEIEEMNLKLRDQFPDMAIIENITTKLDNADTPAKFARQVMQELAHLNSRLSEKLRDKVRNDSSILTFSNSQTVADVLHKIDVDEIFCLESLPGGEGKDLAKQVGGQLVPDHKLDEVLPKIDLLLFGCDRYDTRYFVNKVGTKDLCEQALEFGLNPYVITSSFKEVSNIDHISSKLFELIPRSLVNLISA